MLNLYNFYNHQEMACNDPFIEISGNNEKKYSCNCLPDSENRNYTVMAAAEHILNIYNFYNHQVMACNDPFLEISGE